jgi:hypothetical protein
MTVLGWRKTESIVAITKALCGFSKECPTILKDRDNSVYRSRYADLGAILKIVTPVLAKHGLVVVQMPVTENGVTSLVTTIIHESGEMFEASMALSPVAQVLYKDADNNQVRVVTPQSWGSAITYARRYMLSAMLSLCVDDDDDGNVASGAEKESKSAQQASKPAATSQTKAAPKAEEPPKQIVPLTAEKIGEIRTKILAAETVEECIKYEKGLTTYGLRGELDRKTWGELLSDLLVQWASLVGVADVVAIANKVPPYVGMNVVTVEQSKQLMAAIEATIQA